MTLRTQLVLLQSIIMLVVIVGAGVAAAIVQERQIRDAYRERMVGVALSVAQLPTIVEAFDDPDPAAVIQPIAELIRASSGVTYVVVTNVDGIRYSHPNPDLIGEPASTPPDAAQSGEIYVGTQTGTLGESWRVKAPVFDADGEVIGQVSVGTLESELQADLVDSIWLLASWLAVAAVVGVLLSTWAANVVRRRIYGLEPDEIKAMLDTRDATLHGIREGIVVLDEHLRVVLCNDAAARLLDVEPQSALERPIQSVLDVDAASLVLEGEQRLTLAGERVLLVHADPVVVGGRDAGVVLILMDRTEVDDALRELAGAQGTAEALRAQQHEFANTLHTISGLLELGEPEAAIALIDRASPGGAISATDANSGVRDVEVAALVLAKRSRAKELGIALEIDATGLTSSIDADSADLVTIVGNLVDNAIDATGHDGLVRLTLEDEGDEARIVVDDDGPGVPDADRQRIFELGVSTKLARDRGGRGYGLTLVRRVVSRLGGTISVEASPLGGARVVARLRRRVHEEAL